MVTLQQFAKAVESFKAAFQSRKYKECSGLLTKLKVLMTEFPSLPPVCSKTLSAKQENSLARDVLEHAVLLSIKLEDEEGFERNFLQLQTYYTDQRELLPPSDKEYMILGLNLVRLLVQNCTAEFHTELEIIPPEVHNTDVYIKHAIQLEQWLMEGAYNKVLNCKQSIPAEYYGYFIDQLALTVRDEIASCCEKAYTQLKVSDAREIMMFSNDKQVLEFSHEMVEKQKQMREEAQRMMIDEGDGIDDPILGDSQDRKSIWEVENGYITFQPEGDAGMKDVSSMELIKKALIYAKELERIV